MRRAILSVVSALAMAACANPALAAVSIYTSPDSIQVAQGNVTAVATPVEAYPQSLNYTAVPSAGILLSGNGLGYYTVNLAASAPVISFRLSAVDAVNYAVTFTNGTIEGFYGSSLFPGDSSGGRVTIDSGSSTVLISSVVVLSATQVFISNITSTAPEPTAWVLMILGFGLVGGVLRSRRNEGTLAIA